MSAIPAKVKSLVNELIQSVTGLTPQVCAYLGGSTMSSNKICHRRIQRILTSAEQVSTAFLFSSGLWNNGGNRISLSAISEDISLAGQTNLM